VTVSARLNLDTCIPVRTFTLEFSSCAVNKPLGSGTGGGASVVHLSQRGPRCIGGGASVITSRRRPTAAAAAVFVLEWAAAARGASQNGSR